MAYSFQEIPNSPNKNPNGYIYKNTILEIRSAMYNIALNHTCSSAYSLAGSNGNSTVNSVTGTCSVTCSGHNYSENNHCSGYEGGHNGGNWGDCPNNDSHTTCGTLDTTDRVTFDTCGDSSCGSDYSFDGCGTLSTTDRVTFG